MSLARLMEQNLLLGMLALNQERFEDATRYFSRVCVIEPKAPLPCFYLANAYSELRRYDQAERAYRQALRNLVGYAATDVLDGVTVAWIRETCKRLVRSIEQDRVVSR